MCLYHIRQLEPADMRSQLELCCWINSNPHMIRNILFTDKAHFTCDGVNNTRIHLCDHDNPHGTVKSNWQHCFSVNSWSIHFPATSDRWYLRQLFATWTASTLGKCSSTNMMIKVLPAWRSTASLKSDHQAVSKSNSQTNGLVVVMHTTGYHNHRVWTH